MLDTILSQQGKARRHYVVWLPVMIFCLCLTTMGPLQACERIVLNFNPDWRFLKADPGGAQAPGFDDRDWADVSAPHTYNDIDTFDDWSLPGHRGEQDQWSGRTWYRKSFLVPEDWTGKKIFIEFEAVRQVAEVYLNGHRLGMSRSGFIPFGFDLTPYARVGSTNVIAVMCDNRFMKDPLPSEGAADHPSLRELSEEVNDTIPDSVEDIRADQLPWNNPHWHPAHGGIYRNVRLYVTDPLHIALPLYSFLQTAGPYAYATAITDQSATIGVEVPVENGRDRAEDVVVEVEVFDHSGRSVLKRSGIQRVKAGARAEFKLSGVVENPLLWEPDYPHLYRVVCSVIADKEEADATEIPLGIRAVQWDVETGFHINGRHLKLHGWGQKPTDEWPGLGAAQPDWMHYFTLHQMKEAGGNFVRWGHCAGGPASIAAGDRLGLIAIQPGVDGESDTRGAAWKIRAEAFRDMIIYFRNHPSILIWEGGNQKVSREHAAQLRAWMDEYDPHGGRAYAHRRADKVTAEFMDVGIGTEGGREIASLPVVEGEYDREESPRRVWDDFSPPNFGYHEGNGQTYHLNSEQYAVNQVSQYFRKLGAPNHCGGANWIFSDSTSGGRVATEVARASGEVDGVRLPKEAYYVCQAMFRSDPQIHIIGHWTYPPDTKKTIHVVSNGDEVELFRNGKSLGRGKKSDHFLFEFPDVRWEPGEIKAVAYQGGNPVADHALTSTGEAVALRLTPIVGPGGLQADGSDVVLIDVEAIDAQGRRCPTVQKQVNFQVDGPGIWRGGYNSGKAGSINLRHLDIECGINRVAIRSTRAPGVISVRASSPGLRPAGIAIHSLPVLVEDGGNTQTVRMPRYPLPKPRLFSKRSGNNVWEMPSRGDFGGSDRVGKFTRAFSYSGPTSIVHLEQGAEKGKNIYVDRDFPFGRLPASLLGADWIQGADSDCDFGAMDLMEISVLADAVVSVAHDDRLSRPDWLVRQFTPTSVKIQVNGRAMSVFQRFTGEEESLTLGPNVDEVKKDGNMYVVFVNGARSRTQQANVESPSESKQ